MRSLITLALAAAAIAALGATAAAANPPGTNGKIVTNSDNRVTGAEEIYTVNPDGTGRHLLGFGETGKWSPDGTNIALGLDCCGAGILNFDTGVFTVHLCAEDTASLAKQRSYATLLGGPREQARDVDVVLSQRN